MKKVKSEYIKIPNEAIRLRVLGNSNTEYDQKIKMQLSIEIEKKISEILHNTTNVEEARNIIKENLDSLNEFIDTELKENNYNQKYTLTFGNTFFPEKKYNGIIYEKGYYETLLITLGEGNGNNWWCVLFPPLCLMEAEESNTNNVEYKFFVKEILGKYF
jgi:stage II sporulation protein R